MVFTLYLVLLQQIDTCDVVVGCHPLFCSLCPMAVGLCLIGLYCILCEEKTERNLEKIRKLKSAKAEAPEGQTVLKRRTWHADKLRMENKLEVERVGPSGGKEGAFKKT